MAEEAKSAFSDDDTITSEEDKTSEEENEDKAEDTSKESTEDEDSDEDGAEDKDKEPKRSDIVQKIKYREKFRKAQDEVETLKAQLKDKTLTPSEREATEKELAAQNLIKNLAKEAIKEYEAEKKAEEEKVVSEFEAKIEEILEANPDIKEKELLSVIEELLVEPEVALKIIRRGGDGKPKPKMPRPARAASDAASKPYKTEGKSFWEIAQDTLKDFADKK